MPTITVEMLKGRTQEQRDEFAQKATDLAVQVLKASREKVQVRFVENEPAQSPNPSIPA
jgi:4-oxalocrotonate tautomerase